MQRSHWQLYKVRPCTVGLSRWGVVYLVKREVYILMGRFNLAESEARAMDDITTVEAIRVLDGNIAEHHLQRVIDAEGEALAPCSILLEGAGIEVVYDRS